VCSNGFVGAACEHNEASLPRPSLMTPAGGAYLCQTGRGYDCSAVYLQGQDFVSSQLLTCHVREIEMTVGGVKTKPGVASVTVKGELINRNQVRCFVGRGGSTRQTFEVSVSNDGVNQAAATQLFVAFDPLCQACEGTNCFTKSNVCNIGSACMRPGEVSVYDECLYCDLARPTRWSVRTDLAQCANRPRDNDEEEDSTLQTALIAAVAALVVLVVFLVVLVLVVRKRGSNKPYRGAAPPAYHNEAYLHDVFNGRPIPAYHSQPTGGMRSTLEMQKIPESA